MTFRCDVGFDPIPPHDLVHLGDSRLSCSRAQAITLGHGMSSSGRATAHESGVAITLQFIAAICRDRSRQWEQKADIVDVAAQQVKRLEPEPRSDQ